MTNPLDNWEWIYAFFRGSIELNEKRSARAANLITGEHREVVDDEEIVAKLKPVLIEVHDKVKCESCDPQTSNANN